MKRYRVEVTDQFGTVALILDTAALDSMIAQKRRELDALATGLVSELADIPGCGPGRAREFAVAELARLVADEAAYDRVAERKGLLPL